jgi:hypothetical protein
VASEQVYRLNEHDAQLANLQSEFSALHTSVRNLEKVLIHKVGAEVDKESNEATRRDPAQSKRKQDWKKNPRTAPLGEICDTDASDEENDSDGSPEDGECVSVTSGVLPGPAVPGLI